MRIQREVPHDNQKVEAKLMAQWHLIQRCDHADERTLMLRLRQ